jgi:glutathione peroxidase
MTDSRILGRNCFFKLVLLIMFSLFKSSAIAKDSEQNAYSFSFRSISDGKDIALKNFAGKVIMIVNTASNCGFTNQYEGLETLYKAYKDQGLIIIGVPSNDFGKQEPGSNEEIAEFCQINYGVTFTIVSKESVSGNDSHPFYAWAKKTLGFGTAPKWNFHKYLINRNGELIDYFNSTTAPNSTKIKLAIEKALADNQ